MSSFTLIVLLLVALLASSSPAIANENSLVPQGQGTIEGLSATTVINTDVGTRIGGQQLESRASTHLSSSSDVIMAIDPRLGSSSTVFASNNDSIVTTIIVTKAGQTASQSQTNSVGHFPASAVPDGLLVTTCGLCFRDAATALGQINTNTMANTPSTAFASQIASQSWITVPTRAIGSDGFQLTRAVTSLDQTAGQHAVATNTSTTSATPTGSELSQTESASTPASSQLGGVVSDFSNITDTWVTGLIC